VHAPGHNSNTVGLRVGSKQNVCPIDQRFPLDRSGAPEPTQAPNVVAHSSRWR